MFSIQVVIYANPINNINRFVLQELGILRRVSDCEELVWLLTVDEGFGLDKVDFKDFRRDRCYCIFETLGSPNVWF